MKKYILICFYCFTQSVYSQNVEEFKNINVPSPQAMEMIKYGNIEQDESKGAVNLSIPIYNYQAGEIQVPIYLGATTNAVMVNQPPTWTGVSWSLNALGVITRTVKDEPDDKNCVKFNYTHGFLNSNQIVIPPLYWDDDPNGDIRFPEQHVLSQYIVDNLRNQNADSELDQFDFNFLNYSGTFVMKRDANNNTIPTIVENKDDLKIEIINPFIESGYYYFIIKTPDGSKFTFGGNHLAPNNQSGTAIEESKFILRNVDPTGSLGYSAKTAFYLTEIESYKGDKVFFDYETLPEYNVYFNTEQKLYNSYSRTGCNTNQEPNITNQINTRQVFNKINNGKVLYRIRSSVNNNNVIFENLTILKNGLFYGKILTKIKFENKQVELNYYPEVTNLDDFVYQNSVNKFFLTDVLFKDINNNLNHKYKLEYEDLNQIPKTSSFSQDHLGYFNGRNNSSLFPADHFLLAKEFIKYTFPVITDLSGVLQNSFNFSNHSGVNFADREGYFDFATNGIIKKIIYPTGGYSEFEYEPIIKKKQVENVGINVNHDRGPSGASSSVMQNTYMVNSVTIMDDDTFVQNQFIDGVVEFKLTFGGYRLYSNSSIDYHDFIYAKITDLTANQSTSSNQHFEKRLHLPADLVMNSNITQVDSEMVFNYHFNKDHIYLIEVGFGDDNYNGEYITTHNPNWLSHIGGALSFTFSDGYVPNDGMGVRIKRTKDFDTNGELKNAKRYYYKKLSDVVLGVNEYTNYNWLPQYFDYYTFFENVTCSAGVGEFPIDGTLEIKYNVLTTNSNASISASKFHSNTYKYLTTVFGQDGYENGAIEKEFRVKKDQREYPFIFGFNAGSEKYNSVNSDSLINPFPIFKILRGFKNNSRTENISKGEIVREALFSRDGNVLKKKQESFYQYNSIVFDEIGNINIIKDSNCPFCFQNVTEHLYLGMYKTRIKKNFLVQKITKEYLDGIPVRAYHDNFKAKEGRYSDFDGDGITNQFDFITEEQFDEHFKCIFNKSTYKYDNQINNTSLLESESVFLGNGDVKKINYYYPLPNHISQLTNISNLDTDQYQLLYSNHNFKTPIQTETYFNNELISKTRNYYRIVPLGLNNKPLLYKSLASKGIGPLESIYEIKSFDLKGNPTDIKRKDNFFTSYIWSPQRQLLAKAENASFYDFQTAITNSGISIGVDGITSSTPTTIYQNLSNSFISFYQYDPISKKLIREIDANGKKKTYVYDAFYDLELIKDNEGNIVKEFDQHFKPQN